MIYTYYILLKCGRSAHGYLVANNEQEADIMLNAKYGTISISNIQEG